MARGTNNHSTRLVKVASSLGIMITGVLEFVVVSVDIRSASYAVVTARCRTLVSGMGMNTYTHLSVDSLPCVRPPGCHRARAIMYSCLLSSA